jgi:hypothetical protein
MEMTMSKTSRPLAGISIITSLARLLLIPCDSIMRDAEFARACPQLNCMGEYLKTLLGLSARSLILLLVRLVSGVRLDRAILGWVAEDEAAGKDAPLHPGVAGKLVYSLANAVRLVRTTPTAHDSSLNGLV